MTTATELYQRESTRLDRRKRRADALIYVVLEALGEIIPDDERRAAIDRLQFAFMRDGYEIMSDYTREQAGLPPRGPDGWTVEEMAALEKRRLDVLTATSVGFIPPATAKPSGIDAL